MPLGNPPIRQANKYRRPAAAMALVADHPVLALWLHSLELGVPGGAHLQKHRCPF